MLLRKICLIVSGAHRNPFLLSQVLSLYTTGKEERADRFRKIFFIPDIQNKTYYIVLSFGCQSEMVHILVFYVLVKDNLSILYCTEIHLSPDAHLSCAENLSFSAPASMVSIELQKFL